MTYLCLDLRLDLSTSESPEKIVNTAFNAVEGPANSFDKT